MGFAFIKPVIQNAQLAFKSLNLLQVLILEGEVLVDRLLESRLFILSLGDLGGELLDLQRCQQQVGLLSFLNTLFDLTLVVTQAFGADFFVALLTELVRDQTNRGLFRGEFSCAVIILRF